MPRLRRRTELDRLADLIRSEASGIQDAWVSDGVAQAGTSEYTTYLLTLSALNHVQSRLSPGRYRMLQKQGQAPSGTEQCLRSSAGICGNQAQAMIDVIRALGCVARPVGFYFSSAAGTVHSHAGVEVSWGGRWHYIDVTHGAVFRRPGTAGHTLLSISEVLNADNPKSLAVLNNPKLEFQMTSEFSGSPLDYLVSDPDLLVDGDGVVRLRGINDEDWVRFQLDSVPAYVGSVPASNGGYGWLRLSLLIDEPISGLEMVVTELTDAAGVVGKLCVSSNLGAWEVALTTGLSTVTLPVQANSDRVEVSILAPATKPCCVVFKSISARRVRQSPPALTSNP
jgi:transglutaminase superfamily protein